MSGVDLISEERSRRQEKYSPEHDRQYADGELARAAACYATPEELRELAFLIQDPESGGWFYNNRLYQGQRGARKFPEDAITTRVPEGWPFSPSLWKPADRVRELAKAGALIAAEIDRLLALTDSIMEENPQAAAALDEALAQADGGDVSDA